MGIFDKAKDLINANEDKIDAAVDKAGDVIDAKTGGKHTDKIEKVEQTIKDKTGNL